MAASLPPARVEHLVQVTPDELVVADGTKGRRAVPMGFASGVGLFFGIILFWRCLAWLGIADLAGSRALDFIGTLTFATSVVLGFLVYLGIVQWGGGQLTFSRSGLRRGDWSGSKAVYCRELVLRGLPGRSMELGTPHQALAKLDLNPDGPRGWDYDSVTWLGERAAELLGVPLTDERDPEAWNRLESDPAFRAQMNFDRLIEVNHRLHPASGQEAWAPEHEADLQGIRVMVKAGVFSTLEVRLTTTHLVFSGRQFQLADIDRVGVVFEKKGIGVNQVTFGTLRILVGTEVHDLLQLQMPVHGGIDAGNLRWLEQTIREQAARAPVPEIGSASEVPATLAQRVARRRDPQVR